VALHLLVDFFTLFTVVSHDFSSNIATLVDIACSISHHVGVKITILCDPDRLQCSKHAS